MFVLGERQMNVLGRQTFEGEMVFHIARYFPERFQMMGEEKALETVRMAMNRAGSHQLIMKREVCLFLNCMLVLGSYFDSDPKFSWVPVILDGGGDLGPSERMTQVNSRMLRLAGKWTATSTAGLLERIERIGAIGERPDRTTGLSPDSVIETLQQDLHEDLRLFDREGWRMAIEAGKMKAERYQLADPDQLRSFISFTLLLGSGFDRDPQFHWIGAHLKEEGRSSTIQEGWSVAFRGTVERLREASKHNRPMHS